MMGQQVFEVTGADLPARDGSDRQQVLEEMFRADAEVAASSRDHSVRFEEFDDQGAAALAVFVDDKEVGVIEADKAGEVTELFGTKGCTVTLGVNGYELEDYERIIDRYKDKKFWKQEDPDFDDKQVNKDYEALMKSLKAGSTYQAFLHFSDGEAESGAEEALTEEEKKQKENMERFVKYFRMLLPLSIVLIVIGVLFLWKISTIMGLLNILFGVFGVYFSLKYTAPDRKKKKQEQQKKKQ